MLHCSRSLLHAFHPHAQIIKSLGNAGDSAGATSGPPSKGFAGFWEDVKDYISLKGNFRLAATAGIDFSNITGVPTLDQVRLVLFADAL